MNSVVVGSGAVRQEDFSRAISGLPAQGIDARVTRTNIDLAVRNTADLIRIPSVTASHDEHLMSRMLEGQLQQLGMNVETFEVRGHEARNVLGCFGTPKIVFTTHMDVVPAPEEMFIPRIDGETIFGRGACDTKGIISCMIEAASILKSSGQTDFGLLFVVGEETTGAGARQAAIDLQNRGIEFIVNGEPTEGKLVNAHKGVLNFKLTFGGQACHSGYPQRGIDANRKMIKAAQTLYELADLGVFGTDSLLGETTLNLGVFQSDNLGAHTIAKGAEIRGMFRTAVPNRQVLEILESLKLDADVLRVGSSFEPVRLLDLPGFERDQVAYGTDVPHFLPLGAKCLLYGPGSISFAHSDKEQIAIADLEQGLNGYLRIFDRLIERTSQS